MILTPSEIGFLIIENQFGRRINASSGPVGGALAQVTGYVEFLDVAIAVCLAESSGNTAARASSSSATGLWQVLAQTHAGYVNEVVKASNGIFKVNDLTNPIINTIVARRLYDERQWKPWEAYNKGLHRKHLGHGAQAWNDWKDNSKRDMMKTKIVTAYYTKEAIPRAMSGTYDSGNEYLLDYLNRKGEEGADNLKDTLKKFDPREGISKVLEFIKDSAIVIGAFWLGLVAVVLGVLFLVSMSKQGKRVIKTGTKVATKGVV